MIFISDGKPFVQYLKVFSGRLSSLKVASSLLTLAFFYDIFWVLNPY